MERIKAFFKDFSTQIIAGTAVSIVITTGVGVWAWFRKLDGFYITLLVIGVLTFTMIFVNQFDAFFQRRKRPLYQQSCSYIDQTLRGWLYRRGFSLRGLKQDKYDFVFVTKDLQERPIAVGKPKDDDMIALQTTLRLNPEETAKLDALNVDLRRQLLAELRVSLAMQMVAYEDIDVPLKRIVLSYSLVLDQSFGRDSFLQAIDRIRYALVSVLEILKPILERKTKVEPPIKMDEQG